MRAIRDGDAKVVGHEPDGAVKAVYVDGQAAMPTTMWSKESHNAQSHGTKLLSKFLPGRTFPFPKSLYAVEDALRLFVIDKPEAKILDFFSGSGTTAHAVMRLNRQDGGRRQSISITNNEVSESEAKELLASGLQPGDDRWEALGIFEHITRPRIEAAVTGRTPDGEPVKGEYKFAEAFPFAEGLDENVEFFELTYQDEARVELDMAFNAISPLLWMRAGGVGNIVGECLTSDGRRKPYAWSQSYAVLFNTDRWQSFLAKLPPTVSTVFIVTDSQTVFSSIAAELPHHVGDAVRLYERYLATFAFNQHLEN